MTDPETTSVTHKEATIKIKIIDGKKYVVKRLVEGDLAYLLEEEVSRRLADCDQIYTVHTSLHEHGRVSIVSEYVCGKDMETALPDLTEPQIVSLVCQVLMLNCVIHAAAVSHNNLQLTNIRVQKTQQKDIDYVVESRIYRIPTFGVRAVLVNFGEATVKTASGNFKIPGTFLGDSHLRLDIRYDMYRFLNAFSWAVLNLNITTCARMRTYIREQITEPLNFTEYKKLYYMIPSLFQQYAARDFGVTVTLTKEFLLYLATIPDPGSQFTDTQITEAVAFVNNSEQELLCTNLLSYIQCRSRGKTEALAAAIDSLEKFATIWYKFLNRYKEFFRHNVETIFSLTKIQHPAQLVDIIITSYLL